MTSQTPDITARVIDGQLIVYAGPFGARETISVSQPSYKATEAHARLITAGSAALFHCRTILTRLDLEAEEQGPGAVFPCAAMRDDLRAVINAADGS